MLRTLQDLEKCTIGATDGDIGRVKDVYFDDHAWVVRYLIVETGSWTSSRKVLISPISIRTPDWPAHQLPVGITREQVKHSPDIDTDKPVSRQQETQFLGYYGYSSYWDGTGLWGAGMLPYAMYPGYSAPAVDRVTQELAVESALRAERAQHLHDNPHLRSSKAVVGYHLQAIGGEVGHVEGLLIDDQTWAIRYLVVNTSNWWMGHKVLIAPQWIDGVHWSDRTVTLNLSREVVQNAPHYDPAASLDRQGEVGLYTHYGYPPYWTAGKAFKGET